MSAIREKIEKLLRLASSENRHEAELAMQKATELAIVYEIELSQLSPTNLTEQEDLQFVEHKLTEVSRIDAQTRYAIAILRNYSLQVFLIRVGGRSSIYLFGRKKDLDLGLFLYNYLASTVERLWRIHQVDNPASHRSSYICGVLHGIHQSIRAQKEASHHSLSPEARNDYALYLKSEEKTSEEELIKRHANLRPGKRTSVTVRPSSFSEGVKAGEGVELDAGLEATDRLRLTSVQSDKSAY